MRALPLLLLLAAPAFGAIPVVSTAPFSVGGAALSDAEAGDMLGAAGGPYVIVGDRLVKVRPYEDASGPDEPVSLDEGTTLVKARVAGRLEALRAAAREGRATPQDKAEARALAVSRSALMSLEDRWFLRSLFPELSDKEFAAVAEPAAVPFPGPAGPADALAARLRSRLTLDDAGVPLAREALDMALRRLLDSPTARKLAEEFIVRGVTVKISFGEMEHSVLFDRGGRKAFTGYGGTAARGEVKLNREYLSVDADHVLRDLPATLGHELLGHSLGSARAEAAGVQEAWNLWRGDELGAGVTGWLIAAELGRVPNDAHMRRWLEHPESYFREMHLLGGYYAGTFSREEAADPAQAIRERLARVDAALEVLDRRAAQAPVDWDKVIDHFKFDHGVDPRRLALVRSELSLANASTPEERAAERKTLLAVRGGLLDASAVIDRPEERARFAAAARMLSSSFFAEEEARVRDLGERLRALAGTVPPRDAADFDAGQIREMYLKDVLDNPSHWPLAR